MALVGTTYLSYGQAHWSTLFATAPSNLSTAGVPLPDGSRFVVEFAKVTPATVDDSPAVTWVDITLYVSSLAWLTGDTNCALSRWPIEQSVYTCNDLTALLGDFVEGPPLSATTGPCPGSFIRWGIISGGVWRPMQSHIVETIDDVTAGRVRGWRITAYGTLLYFAGITHRTAGGGFADLTNIQSVMQTVCSSFVEASTMPWPWAQTLTAASSGFPFLISPAIAGSLELPALQFLHQLADSQGQRLYNDRTGGMITEDWTAATVTAFRISDEPKSVVDGHGLVPGTIGASLAWRRSQDQCAGRINYPGLSGFAIDLYLWTKWGRRQDAPGFPKLDTRAAPTTPQVQALCDAAASILLASEVRLDRITVDTAADAAVWPLLTAAVPLWTRCKATVERRRPGTTWREVTAMVFAVSGAIDFTTAVGHAKIDYYTRMVAA